MIDKSFVEKIEGMSAPNIREIGGQQWSDKKLHAIMADHFPAPEPMQVNTLTGLIDYIEHHLDVSAAYTIHVLSESQVRLYGEYEPLFGRRKHFLTAVFGMKGFRFGDWLDQESFVIQLQARFDDQADRAAVLSDAGNVVGEARLNQNDDGVTQQITVNSSIGRKSDKVLKNPVILAPYRTFPEITQIQSPFVFRMKKIQDECHFALFECDGEKWKLDAIHAIRDYLKEKLGDKASIIA